MRYMRLLIPLVLTVGCGDGATASPAAVCVEQSFRAELHVDAQDPRKVWATHYGTGQEVTVRPRPPNVFTFDPDRPSMLFDGDRELLSFSGEISQTGCFDAATRVVYLGVDDLPDPNRPPN